MSLRTLAIAASIVALTGGGASAASYTYNFGAPPPVNDQASQVFHSTPGGGPDVTVKGAYYTSTGSPFAGTHIGDGTVDVENNSYGLISCNRPVEPGSGNSCSAPHHAIDSIIAAGTGEGYEAMVFDFGKVVNLVDVVLGWSWNTVGGSASNGTKAKFDLWAGNTLGTANFKGTFFDTDITSVTGQFFVIGASGYNVNATCSRYLNGVKVYYDCVKHKDTAFKIKSMSVEEVAPVPLPAAGLLLVGGLGGLAALRRKRA